MAHNNARPLVTKEWGFNWLELIPPEFRSALKYKTTRIPGVPNNTNPEEPAGLVISSKTTTDRLNELEKETLELDATLELPITTRNHEIIKDYGGAEVDVVLVLSDDAGDIEVGEGVQWAESYTKTLSTQLGIAFSVGKRLTSAFVDAVVIQNGGSGYSNGTYIGTLTPTDGNGTGAAFSFTVAGGVITSATVTAQGSGYTNRPVVSGLGGGTGAVLIAILGGWPELLDKTWDEEMQVDKFLRRRVVDPLYPVDLVTLDDGEVAEIKAIDKWHSWLELSSRTPEAVDEESARINYAFRPYKFPGTIDPVEAYGSNAWLGYRAAKADLVRTKVKTWWEFAGSTPSVAFDEIISDTIVVAGLDRIERYTDVLHNGWVTAIGVVAQVYPPTSPSFTEYYQGTPSGSSTTHSIISLQNPGAGGYIVGDILFIGGIGDSAQIQITAVQAGGFIWTWIVLDEGIAGTYTNPVSATGGTGSGAAFNITVYEQANFTPGTAWVGTEKVISASVTKEKEKNLWKIQTETVVMR